MSTDQHIIYLQRLRATTATHLASIDEMLMELGKIKETTSAPRQRRNLKAERIARLEMNRLTGSYKKPQKKAL